MFEVIRWISLALCWAAMGLNIAVMIRGIRINKSLKTAQKVIEHLHELYEGRPPVKFCYECEYWKNAAPNEKGFLICPASGMDITAHDYCSYFAPMKEVSDEG